MATGSKLLAWHRPRTTAINRVFRVCSISVTLLVVIGWFLFLRPTILGGPAGYILVSGNSMLPGLESGDLVVTARQTSYAVGDVVVYRIPAGEVGEGAKIVHRIIGVEPQGGYVVQGDNRDKPDKWRPLRSDVEGKVQVHVPKLGMVFSYLHQPIGLALIAGLTTIVAVLGAISTTPREREPEYGRTGREREPEPAIGAGGGIAPVPIRLYPSPFAEPQPRAASLPLEQVWVVAEGAAEAAQLSAPPFEAPFEVAPVESVRVELVSQPEPAAHASYLFLSVGSRYTLLRRAGAAPAPGTPIQLDFGAYTVLRVGPVPLPGHPGQCAFLEPMNENPRSRALEWPIGA